MSETRSEKWARLAPCSDGLVLEMEANREIAAALKAARVYPADVNRPNVTNAPAVPPSPAEHAPGAPADAWEQGRQAGFEEGRDQYAGGGTYTATNPYAAASPYEGTADGAETQANHFAACGCHDSWDQCPCADSGHPVDRSCGCCPLGTGICGPWPATARADAIAAYWEHPQANSIGLRGDAIWAAVQAALPTLVAAAVAEERAKPAHSEEQRHP